MTHYSYPNDKYVNVCSWTHAVESGVTHGLTRGPFDFCAEAGGRHIIINSVREYINTKRTILWQYILSEFKVLRQLTAYGTRLSLELAAVLKLQEIPKVCFQINSSSAGFFFTRVHFHSAREYADKMMKIVMMHSFHGVWCTVPSKAAGWIVCLSLWDAFKT